MTEGSDEKPSPIVHLSDGPALVLADGSVVRPYLKDADGAELMPWTRDQGSSVYGRESDERYASLALVDAPEVEDVVAIREVLRAYDF